MMLQKFTTKEPDDEQLEVALTALKAVINENKGDNMTIRDIIIKYSQELEKISDTPRLDVELFLQKALGGVDRIYIHLNLNKELTTEQYDEFIKQRKEWLQKTIRDEFANSLLAPDYRFFLENKFADILAGKQKNWSIYEIYNKNIY